ncbi:hypothetical protein GWK47_053918 [Chionoecetes opilio]|uniref:Uncharacterized protein n=1 Tax=Chionoecetes opilio TaxID=41210 RepID=A0A8J4YA75_CHIOP|nr:hypothetical protein GWK47_053918 [Chionoecetes opilio]
MGRTSSTRLKLANTSTTTAALTVSQLLVFNSVKHARSVESTSVRHSRERESPLPLYLSLKIHAVTRSRGLIDTLFSLWMCVSYDRLLQLTADIANGVCQRFNMEEVVCPPKLRKGLFTTGAVDNIDHNPSSATAKDSFHGTGISLMQHPSHTNGGLDRGVVVIGQDISSAKSVAPLPSVYTSVPPAAMKTKHFTAPAVQRPARPPDLLAAEAAVEEEYGWLRRDVPAARRDVPAAARGLWTPNPNQLLGEYEEETPVRDTNAYFMTDNNTAITVQVGTTAPLRCQVFDVAEHETMSQNRDFYILGSEDTIRGTKLPFSGQVLSVFFHNHLNLKKERADSARVVVEEVLVFWDKARIPTQRQDKILAKVQALHDRWKGL